MPLWIRPKCDDLLHILVRNMRMKKFQGWNMRMKIFQGWNTRMKIFQGWDIQEPILKLSRLLPLWTRPKCDGLLHVFMTNIKTRIAVTTLGNVKNDSQCAVPLVQFTNLLFRSGSFFIAEKYLQWFYHNRRYSSTFSLRLSSNKIEIKIR